MKNALVSLFAMIALVAPAAAAEESPLPQPIVVVASVLQLSEGQVQTMVEIIQTREAAMRPIAEGVQKDREALEALLATTSPDPAAVGTLVVRIRAGERNASEVAQKAAASFAETLTEEQREKLQFLAQAANVAPVLPAFKAVGLL